jgi:hypothetical protein
MLKEGSYTQKYHGAVNASLGFLAKLHEQSVEAALKHPAYHMIPELKAAKEAQDGKKESV